MGIFFSSCVYILNLESFILPTIDLTVFMCSNIFSRLSGGYRETEESAEARWKEGESLYQYEKLLMCQDR